MDKYREERIKVSDTANTKEEKAEEYYKLGYEFYTLNNYEVSIEELKKSSRFNTRLSCSSILVRGNIFQTEKIIMPLVWSMTR